MMGNLSHWGVLIIEDKGRPSHAHVIPAQSRDQAIKKLLGDLEGVTRREMGKALMGPYQSHREAVEHILKHHGCYNKGEKP